jgi:hypothetical protein
MHKRVASVLAILTALGGCAAVRPTSETIKFSGTGAEFAFEKRACVLTNGKYTDLSGKGNPRPWLKFIAVTNGGQTVGEWTAFCAAVVPGGTSSCDIVGPKKAYYECSNYDKFVLAK